MKISGKKEQPKYRYLVIETVVALRFLFLLPLQQIEGTASSLLPLMRLNLPRLDQGAGQILIILIL